MERKNVFDLLAKNTNISTDLKRILDLFHKRAVISNGFLEYTLYEYVDLNCFTSWKNRGRCIDLQDFLNTICFNEICKQAPHSIQHYALFAETIYNLWMLAYRYLESHKTVYSEEDFGINRVPDDEGYESFYFTQSIIIDSLSQLNYAVYYFDDKEQALVAENKPEVTAVAEMVDDSLSLDIVRYNHFRLKGDLKAKKHILLLMGGDLESKRPQLKEIHCKVERNLFELINRLDIRHHNQENIAVVSALGEAELEKWYDELYQLMLYAYLDLDNTERNRKAKAFLESIRGGAIPNGQTLHGNPGPDSPEH